MSDIGYSVKNGLHVMTHVQFMTLIRRCSMTKEQCEIEDRLANQAKLRALGVRCRCAGLDVDCTHAYPTKAGAVTAMKNKLR